MQTKNCGTGIAFLDRIVINTRRVVGIGLSVVGERTFIAQFEILVVDIIVEGIEIERIDTDGVHFGGHVFALVGAGYSFGVLTCGCPVLFHPGIR